MNLGVEWKSDLVFNGNIHSYSKRSQTLFQSYLDCLKLIRNNIQTKIYNQLNNEITYNNDQVKKLNSFDCIIPTVSNQSLHGIFINILHYINLQILLNFTLIFRSKLCVTMSTFMLLLLFMHILQTMLLYL